MNHLIRRYQQPLLIVFTVLIIISFVGFFNGSFMDKTGGGDGVTIYGRPVSQVERLREGRKFELARSLGMQEMLMTLAGKAQSMDEAVENFVWNSMVVRHEAGQLGISASDEEVLAAIQAMPVFQTNAAFDPLKYTQIFENALQPRGLGKDQLEELIRDDLRLKKMKSLLGATVAAGAGEVRASYDERYQKVEASVVRLKLDDFLATATAPDEDVKKLYDERAAQLKSDEKRKLKVAAFILPTTDKPLEPKERAEALGKLGRSAEDFSAALAEKDANFDALAEKAGVKVEETPEFSRREPPPEFATAPEVTAAAFKLSQKTPISDVVGSDRGYYVLQLTAIIEARPLTAEEAKPQLVEQLKRERAQEALNLKAAEIRTKIDTELKAGKPFAEAVQTAGAKAEPFAAFSQAEPKFELPDAREVMMAAFEMKEGQLSPFTPTAAGGVIIHVDKRPPVDDSKFAAQKVSLEESLAQFSREALFSEWLKQRRAEARITEARRG